MAPYDPFCVCFEYMYSAMVVIMIIAIYAQVHWASLLVTPDVHWQDQAIESPEDVPHRYYA